MIFGIKTNIFGTHIGPRKHKHQRLVAVGWIHGHFSVAFVVKSIPLKKEVMFFFVEFCLCVKPSGLAPARHIHMYRHVGALGIVHYVLYGIEIQLGFPIAEIAKQRILIKTHRSNHGTRQGNVHRQGGIAHIVCFIIY